MCTQEFTWKVSRTNSTKHTLNLNFVYAATHRMTKLKNFQKFRPCTLTKTWKHSTYPLILQRRNWDTVSLNTYNVTIKTIHATILTGCDTIHCLTCLRPVNSLLGKRQEVELLNTTLSPTIRSSWAKIFFFSSRFSGVHSWNKNKEQY